MTSHFHYGHGLTGHGPEDPGTCHTITCLASCVREDLAYVAEGWGDQAHGERFHIEQLKKNRPASGADPVGYPGSWESIADAAMRALECFDNIETVETLRMNLSPERVNAPLYRGKPDAWRAELRRLLLDSGTYPMATTIDGGVRFYVWECDRWECLLSEHDAGYVLPLACRTNGGYVPCACRDCMETLVWSPMTGLAPYCNRCEPGAGDCGDRDRGECAADPGDGDE
jgi:hypothetical protein